MAEEDLGSIEQAVVQQFLDHMDLTIGEAPTQPRIKCYRLPVGLVD